MIMFTKEGSGWVVGDSRRSVRLLMVLCLNFNPPDNHFTTCTHLFVPYYAILDIDFFLNG